MNNAGIVRDRMFANTSEEEFDAVIAVHLKGHFATMRHAAAYWRAQSKAGNTLDARIINTSSGAGLQGSVGQANYSAAKAGIAAMTLVAAAEMGRYGVTVNAIAPSARTRMTETVFADMMSTQDSDFDAMAPENISPLVVWLGSVESRDVTGKMFEVEGGIIRVAEGWAHGPEVDKGARWDPADLGPVVTDCSPRRARRCRSTAHKRTPEPARNSQGMRAYGFTEVGGPSTQSFLDVPIPEPGSDELRVQVRASAVNPGDWKVREGSHGHSGPTVLGREVAGTVVAIGPGVAGFSIGDEVFGGCPGMIGGWAEQALTIASFTALRPSDVNPVVAAALPVAAGTAFDALNRLDPRGLDVARQRRGPWRCPGGADSPRRGECG